MSNQVEIAGAFADEELCAAGIEALREAGFGPIGYFSPIPSDKLLEACGLDRSPVRGWVLCGGITGALTGFALTIGTSLTWSHVVGGKPIISLPPFIIIAFELMILLGGISAVLSTLVLGGLLRFESLTGFSSRFASDSFGVTVRCARDDAARVESILRGAGALEVTREDL